MKHIIIAIEYLIKWTEVRIDKTNDAIHVANYIYKKIIIQFGCLKILISDQGTHFLNSIIKEMTNKFNMKSLYDNSLSSTN